MSAGSDDPASSDSNDPRGPGKGLRGSFAVLGNRQYALFIAAAFVSNIGLWLSNLAVPYVIFQTTGSALWVSAVTFAQFVPNFFMAPFGGSIADRYDRRRVLLITQAGAAIAAAALWLAWSLGARSPALILVLIAVAGALQGLNLPSWQAFVADLVPRSQLKSAVAVNSLQFNAARSVGPAVAGVIIAVAGPGPAFMLNAVSFLAVLGALVVVRPGSAPRVAPTGGIMRQFAGSLRYVQRQPGIAVAIAVAVAVGALGNPIFQFTVIFAGSVWDIGPTGLGLLNAALGVGVFVAAPFISSGWHRLSRIVTVSMALQGVSLIGFALSPNAYWGAAALVFVGASFLAAVTASNSAVQFIVAEPLRGRVIAVRTMFFIGSMPVGAVAQGALADLIGPRPTVVIAGAVLIVCGLVLTRGVGRFAVARLDDPQDGT